MALIAASARLTMLRWNSLWDVFLAARTRYADRPALWVDGCLISYTELHDRAARLAGVLRTLRSDGDTHSIGRQCGVLVNRTPSAYAAVLASLMAGMSYVPLNPRFPSDRLRRVLQASACETIIIDSRSVAAAQPLLASSPRPLNVLLPDTAVPAWASQLPLHTYFGEAEIAQATPLSAPVPVSADEGAYLLFTSGSTGAPKGILISHRNALSYLDNVASRYEPVPEDRFSQLFDFSFDLSVHDMFLCWSAGACLYCAPEGNVVGLGDFIRRCGITFWFSVPSLAAFMARAHMLKPGRFETLRYSLFCGEALPTTLARKWQCAAPNSIVDNLYGPTEATIAFTAFRLPRDDRARLDELDTVPIGSPLPGQQAVIIDSDGKRLPEGEPGELCLGGSQVAAGYWRSPGLSAEKFRPPNQLDKGSRWYRTGDRALLSSEHGLIFLGRMDRQAKILGHRVELSEIEAALRASAAADLAAAIAWPVSEGLAGGVVGFLHGSDKDEEEVIAACRQVLPSHMVPSKIWHLADWPLNANGKTDYTRLAALLENKYVRHE